MPLPSSDRPPIEDLPRQIAFGRQIVEAGAALSHVERGLEPSAGELAALAHLRAMLELASRERSVSVLRGSPGLTSDAASAVLIEAVGPEFTTEFGRMAAIVGQVIEGTAAGPERSADLRHVRRLLLAMSEVRAAQAATPLTPEARWPTPPSSRS